MAVVALISIICGYSLVDSSIKVDSDTLRVVSRRYGPDSYDYGNSKSEFGRLSFDLDADFTPLFDWNTKQVFNRNAIVLWDTIITSKDNANLTLRNVPNKYALIDVNKKWSHQQANLSLQWDVTPYVGLLQGGRSKSSSANFVLSPAPVQGRHR
ncbi:Signal peptidase complex subunit [Apophysomyces sp. BC1021]|nr:Signal peptidase complex subunit [Apophysomyces sp. BC1021]